MSNESGVYHEAIIYFEVYRDTDKDGIPDYIDTDDDGDGYSDREEELYGTDPKSSESVPDPTNPPDVTYTTFIEGKEIDPIYVREPQSPFTELRVLSLPDGLTYNPETRLITGIIEMGEWKENQKRKYFFMKFEESFSEGGITETQAWGNILELLRDSDNDGVPDIDETPEDTTEEETSTVPGTKPENTKPETTVPENTKPVTTVPEVTKPESTVPVSTNPSTTVPEVTKPPVTTKPESSSNASTVPNESKPEEPDPSTQSTEEEQTTKTTIPTGTTEDTTTEKETKGTQTTDGAPVTTKSTTGSSISSDSVIKTTIPTKITTTSAQTDEGRFTSPIKNTPKNDLKENNNSDLPDTGNQSDNILIILGIISLMGGLITTNWSERKL